MPYIVLTQGTFTFGLFLEGFSTINDFIMYAIYFVLISAQLYNDSCTHSA